MANDLQKAKEQLDKEIARRKELKAQREREALIKQTTESVARTFANELKPAFERLSTNNREYMQETVQAVSKLKIEPPVVNVPEIKVPEAKITIDNPPITVPEPKITIKQEPVKFPPMPEIETKGMEGILSKFLDAFKKIKIPTPEVTVDIPPIKTPEVKLPDIMEVKGEVGLTKGFDRGHPLFMTPVDFDGKPLSLGGGTGPNIVGIKANGKVVSTDNRLPVELEAGSGGLTDDELRASAVPVSQVSGANWSVFVSGSTATGISLLDPDGNPIRPAKEDGNLATIKDSTVPASSFDHASVSIGTTATQLVTSSVSLKFGIRVRADSANTAKIYVGNSDVTANTTSATDGYQLDAGDSIFIPVNNANIPYARSTAVSQKVFVVYV